MLCISHDFYSNFNSSVASKDVQLTTDIFVSEVTDIIVYETIKFFELLTKLGIKYRKSISDEGMVNIVIDKIQTDPKFVRGLGYLMAENNNTIKENKNIAWNKILNDISFGISKISNEIKTRPSFNVELKKKMMDMIELKASRVKDRNRKLKESNNNTLFWLLMLGVGVGLYVLYQKLPHKTIAPPVVPPIPPVPPTQQAGNGNEITPPANTNGNLNTPPVNTNVPPPPPPNPYAHLQMPPSDVLVGVPPNDVIRQNQPPTNIQQPFNK